MQYSVKDLLKIFSNPVLDGDPERTISSIASLSLATERDLSFLGNKKYAHEVAESSAGVLLLPRDYAGEYPENAVVIRVENPSLELAKLCALIEKDLWPEPLPEIHSSAVIDESAAIGKGVYIGPNAVICRGAKIGANVRIMANNYIGAESVIGDNSILMPNSVVMDYCVLGKRVRLQPGAVIGSDGYGYEYQDGEHKKVPQVGKVVLEDDVDIGANTCIDRARFDKTLLGAGTKVDNLVQIAHNVEIGKGCLIVSQVGISGSTKIGAYCVLGGQVGVAGHLKIGDGAKIGGQSGVNGNIEAGQYVRGTPPYPFMLAHKLEILKEKLPDFFSRLKDVEKHLGMDKKTFSK